MKKIYAKYASTCSACKAEILVAATMWWEKGKPSRCAKCGPGESDLVVDDKPLDSGSAGRSAAEQSREREEKRRAEIRGRHPILGGLILVFNPEGQDSRNWRVGASGESVVGSILDKQTDRGRGYALHDRSIPKSSANIDHLWVTDTEVWVIDTKRWTGAIECRDRGTWRNPDRRLYVGGRDCSSTVAAVNRTTARVTEALETAGLYLPVFGALCFVAGNWGLFGHAFRVDGVACLPKEGLTANLPKSTDLKQALWVAKNLAELYPVKR